jgi:alpha-1,6-mannosyltransferase
MFIEHYQSSISVVLVARPCTCVHTVTGSCRDGHESPGLAALEAAACGIRVVTADSTPSAVLLDGLVDTFRAGNVSDLLATIERARDRPTDLAAAAALVTRHSWESALSAELADLRSLLGRPA